MAQKFSPRQVASGRVTRDESSLLQDLAAAAAAEKWEQDNLPRSGGRRPSALELQASPAWLSFTGMVN